MRASVVTLVSFARDLASSAGSTLACAPASRRRTLAALCTKARGVASPDRVALAVLRQHPDPPHALGRLRARCELSGRSAPENREKFAPSHFVIMVSDRILRPETYHVAASRAVLCISAKSAARLPLRVDAVEKGICKNFEATLIQDREPKRNLDSKIHFPGFVCFKIQFQISFAETFSTVSVIRRHRRALF